MGLNLRITRHSPPPPKRMRSIVGALAIVLALAAPAQAATTGNIPYFAGPNDASQMISTFNQLIQQINGITGMLFPPGVAAAVNGIALPPNVSGQPAIIGLQKGSDANASIAINPNGNGNVILFGPAQGGGNVPTELGMLQIGTQADFVSAQGLDRCPGVVPNSGARPGPLVEPTGAAGMQAVLGPGATVTGYLQILDWLGRVRSIPVCG